MDDYDLAYTLLDQYGLKPYMLTTNRALLQLRNQKVKKLVEAGYLREALGILEKTLSKMPEHIKSLYNAGVIGYILDTENRADTLKNKQWRLYLEKVISLSRGSQASNIAKNLLEGNAAKENIPFHVLIKVSHRTPLCRQTPYHSTDPLSSGRNSITLPRR